MSNLYGGNKEKGLPIDEQDCVIKDVLSRTVRSGAEGMVFHRPEPPTSVSGFTG